MKRYIVMYIACLIAASAFADGIVDPTSDFKNQHTLAPEDKILRWSADLSGTGRNVVFLSIVSPGDAVANVPAQQFWDVYLPREDGKFDRCTGIADGISLGVDQLPSIDPSFC